MSDMIQAWKGPYSYKNFTQININNNQRKLLHFIHDIHNLCVTFMFFTETAIKSCFSQQVFI